MKKCVLIGGGDIGKGRSSYETKEIDEEIVKIAKKDNPTFLFIGLASSFADSYYDMIKKIYKNLGCNTVYLKKNNLIHNPDLVKNNIEKADIIYIGGGDTIKLLEYCRKYKLDLLLKEAYKRGCVLAGISAGAILLSKEGFSDSLILRGESKKHDFVEGFGFVPISFCPHYHINNNKTLDLKEKIENSKREVYCLENGTALKIINNHISIIKSIDRNNAYLCLNNNGFSEKKIS